MGRPKKIANKATCILCKSLIEESTAPGLWIHGISIICAVKITDKFGVSLDDKYEVVDGEIYERDLPTITPSTFKFELEFDKSIEPEGRIRLPVLNDNVIKFNNADLDFSIELPNYTNHDDAINEMFNEFKVEKLGGASGDLGWSSFYSFQRCPYLWFRNYIGGERFKNDDVPFALIVGSLIHLFLAIRYQEWIIDEYPLNPSIVHKFLKDKNVNPDAIKEAWRIYETYDLFYKDEKKYLTPLAIEYHTVDPRTKESCRYDMIAKIDGDKAPPGLKLRSGTYVIEHKSASRRDDSTLTGWVNDGEVIGQVMLYERMKLSKRFGPLQGVIVNLCGKQKSPSFDRIYVAPIKWQRKQHAKDLQVWQAFRQLCTAQGNFPRARANCINRWGKCPQWDHCSSADD